MIDFAALVLGPAMAVFGEPVSIVPAASQPGVAAYPARAVYALKPVEIPLEEGGVHSTNQPTLGIRFADFSLAPKQNDFVLRDGASYVIFDIVPDGQGGADLWIRAAPLP